VTAALRIGIVDTGVNPWHSHVRGAVRGRRMFVAADGALAEDDDFHDRIGHGTAVAGVIRAALPDAELFALRVFDGAKVTYPSLVARAILRAAAEECAFINLSLGVPPGPGSSAVEDACAAALDAGCVLVASRPPDRTDWLPGALAGVHTAVADDALLDGVVAARGRLHLAASGRPRDLARVPAQGNLWGHSFACARVLAHLARQ
jgi:hypothetical protein